MIVDTMTVEEIDREFVRDCEQLTPLMNRKIEYLNKALEGSGKDFYQTASFYTINQNQYVVNYIASLKQDVLSFIWHYVNNTRYPYFLSFLNDHIKKERYFIKVETPAILQFTQRSLHFANANREAFMKEAALVATDLTYPVMVDTRYVSPNGVWALTIPDPAKGFIKISSFTHKHKLTPTHREIYVNALQQVHPSVRPLYEVSMIEFIFN